MACSWISFVAPAADLAFNACTLCTFLGSAGTFISIARCIMPEDCCFSTFLMTGFTALGCPTIGKT